jgi:hypothetical protein
MLVVVEIYPVCDASILVAESQNGVDGCIDGFSTLPIASNQIINACSTRFSPFRISTG